ncbi:Gellan lyase precursor [compost metagenome]
MKAGVTVADSHEVAPGQVRVIAYSQGVANAVYGSGDLLQLQFKALSTSSTVTSTVYLTDVKVSDDNGTVTNVNSGSAFNVTIAANVIDKTALNNTIAAAVASLNDSTVGTLWGQYTIEDKNSLQSVVNNALTMASNASASQDQVNQAVSQLNSALQTFNSSIVTQATIGDLGFLANRYGLTSESSDWNIAKRYDNNHNGRIDISDLAFIARLILNY